MHNLPFKTMFIHVHLLFHPCTPKACHFRFPLLFHVHPSFFYLFPSFPYFDLRYWPHDNYPSPLLPCTTSPSKQCSSMFMCYSIHAHQKHVTFVFPSYFMSIHPFFIHFPHFHILILVIGHMTTIPPLFCHAQPPLQNNVHPCSSVIPSMHTKSMLVLFFIRFSLLFPVHLSFFYLFPSFPYFDLGYWPHDNYPSPLLPCTTSPSKQCSSMFMYCSIHAHQKHVSFVFIRFSLLFHVHLSFFCPFPSFPYFDLRYWPRQLSLPSFAMHNLPFKTMFIHVHVLFHRCTPKAC